MLPFFSIAAAVVAQSSDGKSAAFDAYRLSTNGVSLDHQRFLRPTPTGAVVNLWPTAVAPGDEGHPPLPAETLACLTPNVPVDKCIDQKIGDVSVPTITPYLVANASSAVIIAPGGAYAMLAVDREGTDIAAWANSIGVSAFVIKYRVPARSWLPFGGAPLMDAQRAMGLVRQMAANGKAGSLSAKSQIGFMGFSAGAHLTGHLAVAWSNRTYARVDAADDLPCRPDFAIMVYPWESVVEAPVNAPNGTATAPLITKENPPTMLIQAEDDPVHVENAIFYFHSLKLAGAAPSELHVYPRGGHGYGRCTVSGADVGDEVCTWPDRGQLFLQTLDAAPNTTAPASTNVAIAPAPRNELVSIVGRPTPTGAVVNLWPTAVAPGDEGHPPLPAETLGCLTPNVPVDKCIDQKIGDVSVPTITPYLVPNASSAVIIAPGGGYGMLAVDREGTDIAAWANSIGVSAFVIKYRVPGRSWLPFGGAPLMDAQRAMGLVRQMAANGKAGSLDAKSQIGFMGFSAGAHLTGHLAVAWSNRTYARVDAADDLPCRPDFAIMVYPWESVVEAPVNAPNGTATAPLITKENPPTMLIQAEDDPVHVENAIFYFHALKLAGAPPSELHVYPRGGHGYGRCTVSTPGWHEVCTWPDRGHLFLQTLGAAPKPTL